MSTDNTPSVTINETKTAASQNGKSSTKAFAGVISLLLVIAGVYAMMKPMNQNLNYMRDDINSIKRQMNTDDVRERSDQGVIAGTIEKFTKVESMFVNLKEIMKIKDTHHSKEIDLIRTELSAALLDLARLQECMKMRKTN